MRKPLKASTEATNSSEVQTILPLLGDKNSIAERGSLRGI